MKLLVRVIEARNVPAKDLNGFSDPYVKLQLGKQRFRTKVVKKSLNPSWCEEFTFKVVDLEEELHIHVLDEDKYSYDDFIGKIQVPMLEVFEAKDMSLGTVWYALQPKNKKAKSIDCGEILLTICLLKNNALVDLTPADDSPYNSTSRSSPQRSSSPIMSEAEEISAKEEKSQTPTLADRIAHIFHKNTEMTPTSSPEATDASEAETASSMDLDQNSEESSDFKEMIKSMETKDQGGEVPNALSGGVVLDRCYEISPDELNSILFSPSSDFLKSISDKQGSADLQIGPWRFDNESHCLKRLFSYIKAPSRLVKALKAIEEQTYLKADGKNFAVLSSVSTPDAPYGKTFKVEVLYSITSVPELSMGEKSSRLVISWRVNFSQSTIMKSMIEGGARDGIKETFDLYEKMLSQIVKPLDVKDLGSEKDKVLTNLEVEHESDLKLAARYFTNFTVVSTAFMVLYVLLHIWLSKPSTIQGLEFDGLDLPDSIGEVITSGVMILQGKKAFELISRFMKARKHKGSDHGIKAQGQGWLLTVALIEGSNLAAVDSSGFSDPYVVFTCNRKTRTSSIKFQKSDPLWNEIFEFDAMNEPPSVLYVEVFDFDGPFDEPTSLGHAEINFLKHNISDLSDVWIPLQGKLAQACQSKLHLRIFLDNTGGDTAVRDYIAKMEKEVGKKIKMRSPHKNSSFQKLFELPPEEFLVNDFSCHLRRRMPLQGRMYLSARIVGFNADIFGHKTKFFFLWEDIEDIQVLPPNLSSMGSPIIVMTLRSGRGLDARYGARTQDAEGRLKFYFHSFVSFNLAHRTIMALWRSRALSPEQKAKIIEDASEAQTTVEEEEEEEEETVTAKKHDDADDELEESHAKSHHQSEDNESLDLNMSLVYSSVLSVPTSFFMELFRGSEIDQRVMERMGCLNYSHTTWEESSEKPDVHQRQLHYKFDKHISRYRVEVTSTQQKLRLHHKNGWVIEEVTTLHGIPLGDYFTIHLRYHVEDMPTRSVGCSIQVFAGISWLKYTKHQKRITKNIISNTQKRLKIMFAVLEKEYVSGL